MTLLNCNAAQEQSVRKAAVANRFYTGNASQLRTEVEHYINTAVEPVTEHPQMIISPHAGYIFSGAVAGTAYATIDRNVKKVILIGPSHHKAFTGLSIYDVDAYETPLGKILLNKADIKKLRVNKMVHSYPDAHLEEHCLEVQLPFLQVLLPDFTIVPIITGSLSSEKEVADLIYPLIDPKTLVVISSDFSHFHPDKDAKSIDARSQKCILEGDTEGFLDACGETPIRIAMYLAQKMGLKPKMLEAKNSFETAPAMYKDESRVVGYASIVYLKDSAAASKKPAQNSDVPKDTSSAASYEISGTDKKFMITLARDALNKAVKGEKPPVPVDIPASARPMCGCFVTLTKQGELRGCIGYIEGIKPLYEAIIDNAKNAALSDPRFPKVTPEELETIKVEVSVLTKPESFDYSGPEDLLAKIRPNIDGIILRKGYAQSTFLPQVWEQLPDKVMFLEHLAMKAGLGRNDWKDAQYKRYQAIHFQEK